MKKEILPTLKWIRRHLPGTKNILGLRDIMDEASVIHKDWKQKGIYKAMDELYDEIWVYGNREFYNPIREYTVPESVSNKMIFTGYIPRETPRKEQLIRAKILGDQNLVDYIPWNALSPQRLREKILTLLENPEPYKEAISQFQMTGLYVIVNRLQICRNQ
ncbi:hypothetical protein ACFL7M_07135, partial [Thermodesulfobacteriota bacterium]